MQRKYSEPLFSPRTTKILNTHSFTDNVPSPRSVRNSEPEIHRQSNIMQLPLISSPRNAVSSPRGLKPVPFPTRKSIFLTNFDNQRTPSNLPSLATPKDVNPSYIQQFKDFLNSKSSYVPNIPLGKKLVEDRTNINSFQAETHETPTDIALEATEDKNRNIHNVVKKVQGKLKFQKLEDSKKFAQKLNIFKDMATFIDIKDLMPKLSNTEGYDLLESLSQNVSPKEMMAHRKASLDLNPRPFKRTEFFPPPKLPPECLQRLKEIKQTLQRRQKYMPKKQQSQPVLNTYLNEAEEQFKKSEPEMVSNEIRNDKTDEDEFYNHLEADLRENKFDRFDYDIAALDEENAVKFEDYLKRILRKADPKRIDIDEAINLQRNQLKVFKDRSEKVISIMKRASKKIYKKELEVTKKKLGPEPGSLTSIKGPHERKLSRDLAGNTNLHAIEEEEQEGKTFLTNLDKRAFMVGSAVIDVDQPFQAKLNGIMEKVERISTDASTISHDQRAKSHAPLIKSKGKSPDFSSNKMVSSLMSRCVDILVKEADNQKEVVKNYKRGFEKVVDTMKDAYEKETDMINPTKKVDVNVLEIKFNHKEHFGSFSNKPIKSKRQLGKFLNI